MRIKRERLVEIIVEEVRLRLRELVEAGEDELDAPAPKRGRKPGISSADQDDPPEGDGPTFPAAAVGSPSVGKDPPAGAQDSEEDVGGPAVDGSQPDPEALDPEGDAGEEPSGTVNRDVSGKTVQAVSIEPKSDILPGAKEVVVTFNETTDGLRILVTPVGGVKFFWRNQVHDLP